MTTARSLIDTANNRIEMPVFGLGVFHSELRPTGMRTGHVPAADDEHRIITQARSPIGGVRSCGISGSKEGTADPFLHPTRALLGKKRERGGLDPKTVNSRTLPITIENHCRDPHCLRIDGMTATPQAQAGAASGQHHSPAARIFRSPRHTTRYWETGPADGPLMIFVHGWPEIGLMWRASMEAFASEGWRCVAPDMRGYGGSSAPAHSDSYALKEIVDDMVELHDHLGARPAIWVGHDWGSPVVATLAAHHAARSRGVVLVSVPYFPEGFGLPGLLPLIDRRLYPADQYPDGQWDYFRFYQTHFDQTVSDFDADIPATLASIFRRGNQAAAGRVSPTASVTLNGGRYGAAHRAPATTPDPTLWPAADFDALVEAFSAHGFRPANAWYLNDIANTAYAGAAPEGGHLRQPVLFINGDWDPICDITRNRLGDAMRRGCRNLSVTSLEAGHWLPLERKTESVQAIRSWLEESGSADGKGSARA